MSLQGPDGIPFRLGPAISFQTRRLLAENLKTGGPALHFGAVLDEESRDEIVQRRCLHVIQSHLKRLQGLSQHSHKATPQDGKVSNRLGARQGADFTMIRKKTAKGSDRGFSQASTFDQLMRCRGRSSGPSSRIAIRYEFNRAAPTPSTNASRARVAVSTTATSGGADRLSSLSENVSRRSFSEANDWRRTREIHPRSPVNVASKITTSLCAQSRRTTSSAVTHTAAPEFPRVRAATPCQMDPGNST
jgi:hypothetical protein